MRSTSGGGQSGLCGNENGSALLLSPLENEIIMTGISKGFCETKLRLSYKFNLNFAFELVPEMGGTTHMARLGEQPAVPRIEGE